MITEKHLDLYIYYGGNGDYFNRVATKEESEFLSYDIWQKIDELIQNVSILNTSKIAFEQEKKIELDLKTNCDTLKTANVLRSLSSNDRNK